MDELLKRKVRTEMLHLNNDIERTMATFSDYDQEEIRKVVKTVSYLMSKSDKKYVTKKIEKENYALETIKKHYIDFIEKYNKALSSMNKNDIILKTDGIIKYCSSTGLGLWCDLEHVSEKYNKALNDYQIKYEKEDKFVFDSRLRDKFSEMLYYDFKEKTNLEDRPIRAKELLIENEGNLFKTIKDLSNEFNIDYDSAQQYVNDAYKDISKISIENEIKEESKQIYEVKSNSKDIHHSGPVCPNCGSNYIGKIGTINRAVSVGMLGLASSKIGKTMQCRNCGYKW